VQGAGAFIGVRVLLAIVVLTLTACAAEPSTLLRDDAAAITNAVAKALDACTAPLTEGGDIDDAALVAAGWTPIRRTVSNVVTEGNSTGMRDRAVPPAMPTELTDSNAYESSEWRVPSLNARLHLSRNGGPISERTMSECRLAVRGDNSAGRDVAAQLLVRYGSTDGDGTRSAGGDWLTPRWFEPDIRVRYWRRPSHDIYWVSSLDDHATLEVVAMPDREALDEFSTSRPAAKFVADSAASS
jgi:hypothetical protein